MSRQLLILRHAKSSWDSRAQTDFQRPLAKRGKRDAPRIGEWMQEQGLVPDFVVSSPAKRAKQTAVRACKRLGIGIDQITWDHRIYEAGLQDLLQILGDCPATAATVLLVGHNPGLEMLVAYLGGSDIAFPEDGKLMPTAALAQLEMPEDWTALGAGAAHLLAITRTRSLFEQEK